MVGFALPVRTAAVIMNIRLISNFVLFQLSWFACVIGASKAMPWVGVAITAVVVAWHIMQAPQKKPEIILTLICLLIGAVFDQAIVSSELITYMHHGWSTALVPAWILAMWLAFSTLLNVGLRWMRGLYIVAILFGAIGGPLAYMGAEKLGAVILHGNNSYIVLSLGWAIITPLLLAIAARFDGFAQVKEAKR